jgi:Flp pilus assembly protein TadG
LVETAVIIPIVLFVSVAIFEFGRAYQAWEVLTNATREGTRLATLPNTSVTNVQGQVRTFLQNGQLPNAAAATIAVSPITMPTSTGPAPGTQVTVTYPFSFVVLNPVARLIVANSNVGNAPFAMTVSARMQNEP